MEQDTVCVIDGAYWLLKDSMAYYDWILSVSKLPFTKKYSFDKRELKPLYDLLC